ncbi:MAG: trypsin-like serine protease [Ruminococcaceae bacterium]|nr:trypsin-like serine protease [Oscillospiraceae bacterium]
MKRKSRLTTYFICLLLCISFALSSCNLNKSAGIVDAEINKRGELILIYGDGTEQNLGVVVGTDGQDGQDGEDGTDGKDGKDGEDGQNGSLTIEGAQNGVSAASAKGLRSAVRIICNFEATVQNGYRPGRPTVEEYSSEGSGVIYEIDKTTGSAFIITNYHVVYDVDSDTKNGISDDINVYLYGSEVDGKEIKATYVGGSLYYDIAVLLVENSDILKQSDARAVNIADSDGVFAGDSAIAIGNAQGLGISCTSGIVSVDSEYITMTAADERTEVSFRVMRVDTAINSGNSGGGLYNGNGDLIGIVNAKIIYEGVESIGYAIPSNVAVSIAKNIIDYCYKTDVERVQRALLGITVSASDSKAIYDAKTGRISIKETVSVYEISSSSLAEGVLKEGDVLVSAAINGKSTQITRQHHIIDMMLDVRAGDTVTLNILRDGKDLSVDITVTKDCLTAY